MNDLLGMGYWAMSRGLVLNDLDLGRSNRREPLLWCLPDPGLPELLHATYRRHSFPRHAHDRFAVGVIEHGGLRFKYRGQQVVAPAGWVNLAYPGETHSGEPTGPEGWTYRMFYLDPRHMLEVARASGIAVDELPFVAAGAVWDPALAGQVLRLHQFLERPSEDALARQVCLGELILQVLNRYGCPAPRAAVQGGNREVQRAREFLEDRLPHSVSLAELAKAVGMNPYGLVRAFTRAWGMPPHVYLVQARVKRVASLLRRGTSLTVAADEAGFADQSHMHRHFLRCFGITPGAYRKAHRMA